MICRTFFKKPLWAILFFFCGIGWSCDNSAQQVKRGKPLRYNVVAKRTCYSDTTQHYELYLPSGYNTQKKWPVIFAFDPHGDGRLAVESLKEAAERFGYIIIGSDNSRNGSASTDHILAVLETEALQAYPVDTKRQYAAGFSGGGRVASYMAVQSGNIRGVITCGAGMPGFNPQMVAAKFEVCAIAGREDFNYNEVVQLPGQFSGSDWRSLVLAFDGGHHWPPSSILVEALMWFETNAMRDKLIVEDAPLLKEFRDSVEYKVQKLVDKHSYVRANTECRNGIVFLSNLLKTNKLNKRIEEIENSAAYRDEKSKEDQLLMMEQRLKDGYIQCFSDKNQIWWNSELSMLSEKLDKEKDRSTRQMYCRVKGFLGIICYSLTSKAIAENNLGLASKYIDIYEAVEPQNPDCFFFKAVLLDRKKQYQGALLSLKKALGYGFSDRAKINTTLSKEVLTKL